jgi:hypothetical protein
MKKRKNRKKRVMHRKPCTCTITGIGYSRVYQITIDPDCPHHKYLLKGDNDG